MVFPGENAIFQQQNAPLERSDWLKEQELDMKVLPLHTVVNLVFALCIWWCFIYDPTFKIIIVQYISAKMYNDDLSSLKSEGNPDIIKSSETLRPLVLLW